MNKRVFIILLFVLAAALGGWIYYTTTQAASAEPIEAISSKWWGSGHADASAEAFAHWNEEDPPEVPERCAKCHAGDGFLDYIGHDGSTEFNVDASGSIESVVRCEVCHNDSAHALDQVSFPSGVEVSGFGENGVCMTCHSGMTAGSQVDIVSEGIDDDQIVADQGLVNPHYAFAASTSFGGEVGMGYQYAGKTYANRFEHADPVQTCTQCHDPHSLTMRNDYKGDNANLCAACHSNVSSYEDYKDIYEDGIDYDADGVVEGLYHEIEGVRAKLMEAMQAYADQVMGAPVGWADNFPYVFNDINADGVISSDEATVPNGYKSFSPRLLRAAYNYMFSLKDHGAYVHNGKYVLQLMIDSIEDLASVADISTDGLIRP